MSVLPGWLRTYRRAWLGPDLVAGVIVWGVVTPQAVAYAQIAGLPPEAGLIGALLAYALLGTSRSLVVSATTATSALSAAAVAPLAILSAAVLVVAGILRLGGVMDLVSKPVMTGFLFGLGLTVAIA